MRGCNRRNERIMAQIAIIVDGAPRERDKREEYVVDRCLRLEEFGFTPADSRQIDESVRSILGLRQWEEA
jgi:hypothetical protein